MSDNNDRQRIVLVGPAYPYRGGIAHFTNRFGEALHAAGHEVHMQTFSRQYPDIFFPGKTQLEEVEWELPTRPVRILDSINPLSWPLTGRNIARRNPDIVVLFYWTPFFALAYLSLVKALRKICRRRQYRLPKVILWLHNLNPHEHLPLSQYLSRKLVQTSDSVVTMSDRVTLELKELMPEVKPFRGFHPSYDMYQDVMTPKVARHTLGVDNRETLLFFGLVRQYKGLDLLLRALPLVREKRDVQLIVAGEFYDKKSRYTDLVKRLQLEPHVHFSDRYVPNDQVHLYFSAADVVVQPYRSATQSGVIQTAFHFDKPVVATDVGGLREVIGDGEAGFIAPSNSPSGLAEAIIRFYEADKQQLVDNVRKRRDHFSWKALVTQFESVTSAREAGRYPFLHRQT